MTKQRLIIGSIVIVILALALHNCGQNKPALTKTPVSTIAPTEALYMTLKNSRITLATKTESVTQYVPRTSPEMTLTVGDDGAVELDVPNKGFIHNPTLGALYSDRARIAVGLQFAYWNNWGLSGGIAFNKDFMGYVSLGYDLDALKMPNTFAFIGAGKRNTSRTLSDIDFVGGIAVRL